MSGGQGIPDTGDESGPICLTIDKVENTFFKTEFKNELPVMEEATEDTLPELPEDLEIILPPEILDKLEEDSFNPDSFTAPPFVPKGKRILTSHSRHI